MGDRVSLVFALTLTIACLIQAVDPYSVEQVCAQNRPVTVTSPSFNNRGTIPRRHTCDGQNISPALNWSGIPRGTKSIALICEDPDAPGGTFIHWVLFNIPGNATGLPEGVPRSGTLANGASQGRTSFRRVGYGGPCPPRGRHRYYFNVYALDTRVRLHTKPDVKKLLRAMEGHVLAAGQLMGTYARQ